MTSGILRELKKEFSLKQFGFAFPKPEVFVSSQWRCPPAVYLLYRLIFAVFTIGSLVAFMKKNFLLRHHFMSYMTSWGLVLLTLHFNLAALIVLYRFCRSHFITRTDRDMEEDNAALKSISSSSCSPSHSTDHEMDNYKDGCHIGDAMNNCTLPLDQEMDGLSKSSPDDLQLSSPSKLNLQPSVSASRINHNGCTLPGDHLNISIDKNRESGTLPNKILIRRPRLTTQEDQTRWYLKISWFLFETVSSSAIIITVIYFIAIHPYMTSKNSFEDIAAHGINTVLVFLEIIVSAFPVRLLHAVYTILFGLVYVIFTLIYWAQEPQRNIIYPMILDWNQPKTAIILVSCLLFVVIPFLHSMFFLLYKCRLRCYQCIYKKKYMT